MTKTPEDTDGQIMEKLAGFRTLTDLRASLGNLTADEEALLNAPGLCDEPTAEELAALGPEFVERVAISMQHHVAEGRLGRQTTPPVIRR